MVSPCRNRRRRLSGEKKSFGWRPAVRELSLRFRARQGCLVSPAWRPTLFIYGPTVRITRSIPIKNQGDSQYLLAGNGKSLVAARADRTVPAGARGEAHLVRFLWDSARRCRIFGRASPARPTTAPFRGFTTVAKRQATLWWRRRCRCAGPARTAFGGQRVVPGRPLSSCLVPDALLPCPTSGLH
jgi:hypothetical protein